MAGAFEERALFSQDISAAVTALLQAAVAASRLDEAEAEGLFIEAHRLAAILSLAPLGARASRPPLVGASRRDRVECGGVLKLAKGTNRHGIPALPALKAALVGEACGQDARAPKGAIAKLRIADRLGLFPADYKRLVREKEKWNLYANGITHFYLYSLKTLAFIKLCSGQDTEARVILSVIHELDPEDRSGASVISDLASALEQE